MNNLSLGQRSELQVINLLKSQDFIILEHNYKKFFGEIDIIAKKDDVIVFVEVKARTNPKASMFEIITPSKQRKIIQTARAYITQKKMKKVSYRFDVALVKKDNDQDETITYIPNAFNQNEG